MWVKNQQLELDMEQQTCFKLGKEYIKAIHYHPAYLTYMQNTSREMLSWKKHKLDSRFPGEISITSDMQMAPPWWQKEELKSLLMKVKEESEKAGLKLSIQKTKTIAFGPITSWQIDVEKWKQWQNFIFLGSKIPADGDCSYEIRTLSLWKKGYDQPRQHIKKQRHHFAGKDPLLWFFQ